MEAQFKPYGLVATIATTDASSIVLKDTAGTSLKCNFISVEASGENPDAFFRVAMDSRFPNNLLFLTMLILQRS